MSSPNRLNGLQTKHNTTTRTITTITIHEIGRKKGDDMVLGGLGCKYDQNILYTYMKFSKNS